MSWIDLKWQLPAYFEPYADLFISDFFLLFLLGWCLFQRQFKIGPWAKEKTFLGLFLAIALLSILISEYSSYMIAYWRWGHLAIGALCFYRLSAWLQPGTQGHTLIRAFAVVVALSGVLECAIALPQYALQHQIGLKWMGEPTLVSRHQQAAHFIMPKKAVTSLDYYWKSSQQPSFIIRASGTLPHPNVLGGFLVFSLLMTAFLYEGSTRRFWVGSALLIQIVTLFTSYSRSALFSCIGGFIIWGIVHSIQEKKIPQVWKPVAMGLALSSLLFFPQIFYRGGVVSYNQHTQESDGMRIAMQNVAFLVIRDRPWFGVGFNNYLLAFSNYAKSSEVYPIAVHNIYLLIAVETGIIGLGAFLAFCALILYKGWQMRICLEGRTFFTIFLAFLAIGAVDYYPLVIQQIRLIFFLIAGLISLLPGIIPYKIKDSSLATAT